jgi:hypothetical protein
MSKKPHFLSVLGLKWAFFVEKARQKLGKNCLFRVISGVFGAKSVPNVPGVPLVLWYKQQELKITGIKKRSFSYEKDL